VVGAVLACLFSPVILTADVGNRFIVKTADPEALQEFAKEHGAQVGPFIFYPNPSKETMELYGDQYIVKIPAEEKSTIDRIQTLPGVESVQPDEILDIYIPEWEEEPVKGLFNSPNPPPYTPNDPRYPDQWDKPITETDWAWNTTTGEGVTIGVLDSGVDTTHEDLVDNLYTGYDFNEDEDEYADIMGHGTSVCGVACAKIDNGIGIAGTSGDASLIMAKIFGSNDIYVSTISNAINFAIDNGASIISMSWGSYYYNSYLESVMNDTWDRGAFLCAGAANDNTSAKFYPASYEKVMNVGATTSADERWSSSNYGPHVQIFAPGGLSTTRGGGYGGVQPTSFTTPQIAGLAALIWSAHPEYTNYEVWLAIIRGADTLDSDVGKILRMNSNGALEADVSVTEQPLKPEAVSAASIQNGVILLVAPASTQYTLKLFDVTGRQVYTTNGRTGTHGVVVCKPEINRGVYFWEFKTTHSRGSGKIVYLK
jgi:thermitase